MAYSDFDLLYPDEIKEWYFGFHWNNQLLWELDLPVETVLASKLSWHLEMPLWSTEKGKPLFNLKPLSVLENPGLSPIHDIRIDNADLNYPINIMFTTDRFVILDGLHRLAKCTKLNIQTINVRKVPRGKISLFRL